MKAIKLTLILMFLISTWTANAQWSVNPENMKMYSLKIEGNNSPDYTRELQGLINNNFDILLARVKIDGTIYIFSDKMMDTDAIRSFLKSQNGIKAGKVSELTFSKEEYYKAYALYNFPATEYYSDNQPEKLIYTNKQKEEKAYGLAKQIWIEFFPDTYKSNIPEPNPITERELQEKAQHNSNIDLKSKTE